VLEQHRETRTKMDPKCRNWSELNTNDFKSMDFQRTVAVLPLAATEQHGPHLPLSVDTDLMNAFIHESQKYLSYGSIFFLPTLSVGYSSEHTAFAGTLSLSAKVMLDIIAELGASVAKSGVKKLLLLNAHGGNVGLMDLAARDLRDKHNLLVFSTSWFQLNVDQEVWDQFSSEEQRFGVHAGEIETSLMLHIAPNKVQIEKAENFHSAAKDRRDKYPVLGDGKSAKMGWHIQDYNARGATGNTLLASKEKGERLIQSVSRKLAQLLDEFVDMQPIG
jgi:creatinine amidohydrolase